MEPLVKRSGKKALDRIFSAKEQAYCDSLKMRLEHYAVRFAAKEAVLKALKIKPTRGRVLSGIEIQREATGKPFIAFSEQMRTLLRVPVKAQIELSLAHEREYAIATVVIVVP